MDISKKASQEAILAQLLGNKGDEREAVHNPQEEAAEGSGPGFNDIPPEILKEAQKLYIEQFGEEGYGGDASMEEVMRIAYELMGKGQPEVGSGEDPRDSMKPSSGDMPYYDSSGDIQEQAYKTNNPSRRPSIEQSIIQKMLGGMR